MSTEANTTVFTAKRGQVVFSGYYIAYFACFGIVLPFLPLWMGQHGLSDGEIGLILSSAFIGKVIFGLAAGAISDMTGHRKWVLMSLTVANLIGFYFVTLADSFWPMLLIWFVVGPLQSAQIPISDGLAVSAARRGLLTYSKARLYGSLSFIVVSGIAGFYLKGDGVVYVPLALMIFASFVVLSVFPLPDLRPKQKATRKLALLDVFKLPGYLSFVAAAAILQSSHGALYAIATQHWHNIGFDGQVIGLLWAEGTLAEVILFAFGTILLAKLKLRGLLWLAVIGGSIRWLVLGASNDLFVIALFQIGHAFTFAAVHLSVTSFIAKHVPEEYTSSAQTFYDSMAMGVLLGVSMTISSWLYDTEIQGHVFWGMAVLSMAAGGILFFTRKRAEELGIQ